MAGPNHGVDIATGVEIGLQLHPDRVRCLDEVVQNSVGHLLMGNGAIAVAVDVELDRLEFHHSRAGLIDQPQHSEIGIARERAFASEFREFNRHLIGPTRARVVETDQLRFRNGALAVERSLGLLGRNRVSHGAGVRSYEARSQRGSFGNRHYSHSLDTSHAMNRITSL